MKKSWKQQTERGSPFALSLILWIALNLGRPVSCDATHITAPCREGSGLQRVFLQATKGNVSKVGGINAHGTGTLYNDAMEIKAMRSFWD